MWIFNGTLILGMVLSGYIKRMIRQLHHLYKTGFCIFPYRAHACLLKLLQVLVVEFVAVAVTL